MRSHKFAPGFELEVSRPFQDVHAVSYYGQIGGGETASLSLSLSVPLCSVPPCVFNSSTMVLGGCGKLLSSAYCYRLARGVNLRYFQEGPKTYLFVYKQGDVSNVQLCNVSLFLLHQFFCHNKKITTHKYIINNNVR